MSAAVQVVSIAACLCVPVLGRAQTVVLHPDAACDECIVVWTPVDTFGGATGDPVSPGSVVDAIKWTDGTVWFSSPFIGAEVWEFTATGQLRRVARAGAGPGEYGSSPFFARVDMAVAAIDPGQGRLSLYTTGKGFATSLRLQVRPFDVAHVGDGSFVVSGWIHSDSGLYGLHIVAGDGAVSTMFAPITAAPAGPLAGARRLAVSPQATLWAATVTGGVVEEWRLDGHLIRRFRLDVPELLRDVPMRVDFTSEPPPGQITDLVVDDAGMVWIYAAVPDHSFRPGPLQQPLRPESIYDTAVWVLEPVGQRIVARGRFDLLVRPLDSGSAYTTIETEAGDRRLVTGAVRARDRR